MKTKPVYNTLKRVSAFVASLLFAFFASHFPLFRAETTHGTVENNLTATSTTNLRVGVNTGSAPDTNGADVIKLYKLVNFTFDSDENTLEPEFTTDFGGFMSDRTSSPKTLAEYEGLTSDPNTLKQLLSQYAAYVVNSTNLTSSPVEQTTGLSGYATFTDVAPGQYLALGYGSTAGPRVYSVATADIQPHTGTDDNGDIVYMLYDSYTAEIKATDVSLSKGVSNSGTAGSYGADAYAGSTDTIYYQINSAIPAYHQNAQASNMIFTITDTAPNGIVPDWDTVSVLVSTDQGNNYTTLGNPENANYTKTISGQNLTVAFTPTYVLSHPSQPVSIQYEAKLGTSGVVVGSVGNTNKATLTYSTNPTVDDFTFTQSASAIVRTYGLIVDKYAMENNSRTPLKGAEFKIYTGSDANPIYVKDGTSPVVIETDENGLAKHVYLKPGTYHLEETRVPAGYKKATNIPEIIIYGENDSNGFNPTTTYTESGESGPSVTISGDETFSPISLTNTDNIASTMFAGCSGTNGLAWAHVQNTRGATLPGTGGIGTIVFTVVGTILIVGAAVVLITKARMANKARQ